MSPVALIVGGSTGIGAAAAEKLSGDLTVVVTKHSRGSDHPNTITMDVTDQESVEQSIEQVREKYGEIGVVVFSVSSPVEYKRSKDIAWEEYQRHIDVQVKGFHHLVQSMSEEVKKGIRFVVLLTAAVSPTPPSMMSHYVTAKYALQGLVRSYAAEYKKSQFVMISPGMTETDLLNTFPEKIVEMNAYLRKDKKLISAEEVAEAIYAAATSETIESDNIIVS